VLTICPIRRRKSQNWRLKEAPLLLILVAFALFGGPAAAQPSPGPHDSQLSSAFSSPVATGSDGTYLAAASRRSWPHPPGVWRVCRSPRLKAALTDCRSRPSRSPLRRVAEQRRESPNVRRPPSAPVAGAVW
jgi:hypothetical protein